MTARPAWLQSQYDQNRAGLLFCFDCSIGGGTHETEVTSQTQL
jgi:hypothetical protein